MNEIYGSAGMAQTPKQPEHINIAIQFANEMIDRFPPNEQNQILKQIKIQFKEFRNQNIIEAENKIEYLRKTIEEME